MKKLIFLFSLLPCLLLAESYYPEPILFLNNYFSHHVLVAEKSTHKLYLFKNTESMPELVKSYKMVTGKKSGDKIFQGDYRTPEGVYTLTNFLTRKELLRRHGKAGEIYGVGAFVLNYPNPFDNASEKTGGGIWIHSTNDETRIEKGLDSRGCIVTANKHLIDISKYIELNRTSVIVVHELSYQTKKTWMTTRDKIKNSIDQWAESWQNEDINRYISHYHKDFSDSRHSSLAKFRWYKKAVFSAAGKPSVNISQLSILKSGKNYAVATFKQAYASKTIEDVGKKTLYLKRNEYYQWKIVHEIWTKAGMSAQSANGDEDRLAFRPSMRFFDSQNPAQILRSTSSNKSENN
ncbi:MAG: L,D-transpeptidase family protein [Halobacteriovoraceae bacterium]|jgi:murein L,D-transpeptidase YafK|nr:L,D-transpeptidase family protein [Halobacteriovoraceae bacterium]